MWNLYHCFHSFFFFFFFFFYLWLIHKGYDTIDVDISILSHEKC